MSTAPVSPFVLVGDPSAAACEGDLCPVPEVRERPPATEARDQTPTPVDGATRPEGR